MLSEISGSYWGRKQIGRTGLPGTKALHPRVANHGGDHSFLRKKRALHNVFDIGSFLDLFCKKKLGKRFHFENAMTLKDLYGAAHKKTQLSRRKLEAFLRQALRLWRKIKFFGFLANVFIILFQFFGFTCFVIWLPCQEYPWVISRGGWNWGKSSGYAVWCWNDFA